MFTVHKNLMKFRSTERKIIVTLKYKNACLAQTDNEYELILEINNWEGTQFIVGAILN